MSRVEWLCSVGFKASLLPTASKNVVCSPAGRVCVVRMGRRRRGGGGGPGAGGLAAGVPARPSPRAVAFSHLQRRACWLATSRFQPPSPIGGKFT